jgi:hypothetical protein
VVSGGNTATTDVVLYDSVLGQIAGPFDLPANETMTFQESATITATTSNIATVVGVQDINQCIANASATVTVEGPPPPECKALGASTLRIDDDKIEWKITNQGSDRLTISIIEIDWPAAKGNLTKVKRDRDEIFKGSLAPPSATITSFTNKLDKRQLKAGEQRKLVFEFSKKYKGTAGDYKITVNFAEGCSVTFTPGSSGAFTCSKPIGELTMIWNGAESVDILAWKGTVGSTLLSEVDGIVPGEEVTVSGYAGSPNDVFWQVLKTGTADPYDTGLSTFHLSCSDADMNGPEDCGKAAGDGKGSTGYVNEWILEGMVDSKGTLNCTP